jgi:hypothetical protein
MAVSGLMDLIPRPRHTRKLTLMPTDKEAGLGQSESFGEENSRDSNLGPSSPWLSRYTD